MTVSDGFIDSLKGDDCVADEEAADSSVNDCVVSASTVFDTTVDVAGIAVVAVSSPVNVVIRASLGE